MADTYSNPFFSQSNPFMGRDNPYLTDKINAAQGDLVRNYNLTTQPAYNSAMVKSGSFGNEGVAQMNSNAQLNLQKALGDVSTNMRGQDYESQKNLYMNDRAQNIANYQWDQNFNRQLFNDAYGQNMGNLQMGIGLLGTMAGYNANDLTNGTETYPGGRYLDLDRTATGIYDLDFNRAYHPFCYYNSSYDCPVPPAENRLKMPIRAGEKLSHSLR